MLTSQPQACTQIDAGGSTEWNFGDHRADWQTGWMFIGTIFTPSAGRKTTYPWQLGWDQAISFWTVNVARNVIKRETPRIILDVLSPSLKRRPWRLEVFGNSSITRWKEPGSLPLLGAELLPNASSLSRGCDRMNHQPLLC